MAFAVYTDYGVKAFDYQTIIKPDSWVIGKDTSDVHGITTEMAQEKGVPAAEAIGKFINAYEQCDTLVAHNIAFDYPVLGCELIRYDIKAKTKIEKHICTMLSTVDFCKLPGRYGYKWPKLMELHQILFDSEFDGAHDAMVDVDACARCFFELKTRGIIK